MHLSYINSINIIDVELNVFPSTDLVPTGVLAGTTRALVPAPTGDARGADLVVGVAVGATAVHPCQTVADTLATGYTSIASSALSSFPWKIIYTPQKNTCHFCFNI